MSSVIESEDKEGEWGASAVCYIRMSGLGMRELFLLPTLYIRDGVQR